MKWTWMTRLVGSVLLTTAVAVNAFATPVPNAATIETRTFNDCALSTVTTVNNYPASIEIADAMHPACLGFANLHSWSFSEDGGITPAAFHNNSNFHFGADFTLDGPGEGEGGLRVSPWYGPFVDGRFMANAITGEIAAFGGALPFYSFTVNHGINYVPGTTIRLEITCQANDLFATDPASIQYRAIYNGTTYDSPVLLFGMGNSAECDPNGLWGMLNDGRVGGYFQPRADTGELLTATWGAISYGECPANVAIAIRPARLNLMSHGRWIMAFLEPAPPRSAEDIDPSSLLLNGVAVDPEAPVSTADSDDDGLPELVVRFSRTDVAATLSPDSYAELTLTGTIEGVCFTTSTAISTRELVLVPTRSDGTEAGGLAEIEPVIQDGDRGPLALAIEGISPSPNRGQFTVAFTLATGSPASLAVFDVAGRRVARHDVGALGVGRHSVSLGGAGRLPPGVYVVRLTQDGSSLTSRAVVLGQ